MAQQIIHEQNHCPCGPHVLPGWGSPTPMCARARVRACGRARMRAYACAYPRVCTRVGACVRMGVRVGVCACMRVPTWSWDCERRRKVARGWLMFVIVAWCNCCMCNHRGMGQWRGLCGLTVFVVVMVVSTRRGTLVFATGCVVLVYLHLHSNIGTCILITTQGNKPSKPRGSRR